MANSMLDDMEDEFFWKAHKIERGQLIFFGYLGHREADCGCKARARNVVMKFRKRRHEKGMEKGNAVEECRGCLQKGCLASLQACSTASDSHGT